MKDLLKNLHERYGINFDYINPFGDGHIHQTYKVTSDKAAYILQKFNNKVFPYADRIAHNHRLLIENKIQDSLSFELPLAIPNKSGELFTQIGKKIYRLAPFVKGKCLNKVENLKDAEMAAKAFTELIVVGKNINASKFQEVIPDFNNLILRYQQLKTAIQQTNLIIAGELAELVEFYTNQWPLVEEYANWAARVPLRLTHNDTKINNLIYAEDMSRVKAIIDLDTLMGGYVFYDFGDLARTVACTKEESSTDWNEIGVDNLKYQALKNGFLEAGKEIFTADEIASLDFGAKMMTCIMGLRFLADYLNGNIYYTIHYAEQNFHRAKNQMILLKSFK